MKKFTTINVQINNNQHSQLCYMVYNPDVSNCGNSNSKCKIIIISIFTFFLNKYTNITYNEITNDK